MPVVQKSRKSQIQLEFERYLADPAADIKSCALDWWKTNKKRFPVLGILAKKYLGVMSTSVPCERLFSDAGNIITAKRNRLSPSNAEMLIVLYSNMQ